MNSHLRALWRRIGYVSLLGLLLVALGTPSAQAQVLYGSIVGTVQDSSGGVIPGATVTITNRGTSQTREASTDENGRYTFSNVQAGFYDLAVTADGFSGYIEENIEVTVNRVRRSDVTLSVGSVSESVTVAASALALQTEKTDVNSDGSVRARSPTCRCRTIATTRA
ncbi:MAG: carboxypeptidase-like regulatory domain-containing protein [Bryobacterales bacterium]